ncbi:hypothetical protein K2173_018593 [Erythroxylum novogranatense]|uniref:Uncharacterized protein n=1 Tax=Erythroxylum novogranatense TaxID=1862640 RepID=A0AAV8UC83_9ROSI|nr:hypothetical protein K2173_018593 [Erythroxylum novogranatense]
MEMPHKLLAFVFGVCLVATLVRAVNDNERKPYIVYMGELDKSRISTVDEHHNLLAATIGDESVARESRIHSYGRSFNGFVARLLPHEAKRLSDEEGVVSVFENKRSKLHTTRSWDFLGMPSTVKRSPKIESNIIIGVLDTGIYVKARSFDDNGYGPIPAKWRGKCVTGANFTRCNKKVIGARYYNLDYMISVDNPSPADEDGHGTHTSSTAAGIPVKHASLFGIAKGTARGGVPSARIAMYKVCWEEGCSDMDLLAAFDDAIADGVDIISISIGGSPRRFYEDPIAIGSFHAMKKGILTSCSGGNSGPSPGTVQNVAPWLITVAASGIDRQFRTAVKLGNGEKANGFSINTFSPKKAMYPLTSGALATNVSQGYYGNASACDWGTLDMNKVKGKIVYCLGSSGQDYTINKLEGIGTIMIMSQKTEVASTTIIPGTNVDIRAGLKIERYINTTKNPHAVIYKTKTASLEKAPFVASFSSRGPQVISPNILKPDIAAPGLNILAAYSKLTSVTGLPSDSRRVQFNIISGTSMACPHVSGAAAYVKSFHPDWSPAAIKSALMTTATPMKTMEPDAELGSGSGQLNPESAVHPGLVYDISLSSYISFLCKEGYNGTAIDLLIGGKKKHDCSKFKPAKGTDGLNYPSMHMQLNTTGSRISAVFYRRVTNVGYGKSVYKAKVTSPKGLSVLVIPNTLRFTFLHQKKDFKVVVKGGSMPNGTLILSALLEWNDSMHSVKSPIVIYQQPSSPFET